MAGHIVPMGLIGANPVKKSSKKRKAAPKAKASTRKAPKKARASAKSAPKAKKKSRRKAAKKPASANNLSRAVEQTLREPSPSGYGGNTSTRTAKPRTQKEATMAAKKKASKKKTPKRKAAKRKPTATAAAPKAPRKKARKKKARRKTPAVAAAPKAPKKPRKKKAKRKPSPDGSGPGQFAPGRPNTTLTVRRADDGHFSKLRSQPASGHGPGEVDTISVHRNPVDAGLFILTGATAGAAGFGLAALAGKLYVTSHFALSREKDANGTAYYAVDKTTGKITHADGTPVTSADYSQAQANFSWMRELISGGIAAVGIVGGMYVFEPGGIPRTVALWTGVGAAVEGGVNFFGKLALPWMLRKNQTFATRLAPEEVTTYLGQHPDALKDQPSGDSWTVPGAPLGSAPSGAALGGGCAGSDDCGCGTCCAKRSQALQSCIQNYAGQAQTPPTYRAPMTPVAPGPERAPTPTQVTPLTPEPTQQYAGTAPQVFNRPTGGLADNVHPIVSTRDQARARHSA